MGVAVSGIVLTPVITGVVATVTRQGGGCLNQPKAPGGIACLGQVAVLTLPASRRLVRPPEARHFGDGGLTVAIAAGAVALTLAVERGAGGEAARGTDCGQTTSDEDRPQTMVGQGQLGFREAGPFRLDKRLIALWLTFQETNGSQGKRANRGPGLAQPLGQGIAVVKGACRLVSERATTCEARSATGVSASTAKSG